MEDEEKRQETEQASSSTETQDDKSVDSSLDQEKRMADERNPEPTKDARQSESHSLRDADEDDDGGPIRHSPSAAVHKGSDHGGAHGDDHFAHVLPMPLLVGVLGALVLLTVLTVAVTAVDLGSQGNFIVAMIIATIKAAIVMLFFMHMLWDSKFNVVAFTSSFLFVLLFLGMSVLDRSEYGDTIDHFETDKKIEALQ